MGFSIEVERVVKRDEDKVTETEAAHVTNPTNFKQFAKTNDSPPYTQVCGEGLNNLGGYPCIYNPAIL